MELILATQKLNQFSYTSMDFIYLNWLNAVMGYPSIIFRVPCVSLDCISKTMY